MKGRFFIDIYSYLSVTVEQNGVPIGRNKWVVINENLIEELAELEAFSHCEIILFDSQWNAPCPIVMAINQLKLLEVIEKTIEQLTSNSLQYRYSADAIQNLLSKEDNCFIVTNNPNLRGLVPEARTVFPKMNSELDLASAEVALSHDVDVFAFVDFDETVYDPNATAYNENLINFFDKNRHGIKKRVLLTARTKHYDEEYSLSVRAELESEYQQYETHDNEELKKLLVAGLSSKNQNSSVVTESLEANKTENDRQFEVEIHQKVLSQLSSHMLYLKKIVFYYLDKMVFSEAQKALMGALKLGIENNFFDMAYVLMKIYFSSNEHAKSCLPYLEKLGKYWNYFNNIQLRTVSLAFSYLHKNHDLLIEVENFSYTDFSVNGMYKGIFIERCVREHLDRGLKFVYIFLDDNDDQLNDALKFMQKMSEVKFYVIKVFSGGELTSVDRQKISAYISNINKKEKLSEVSEEKPQLIVPSIFMQTSQQTTNFFQFINSENSRQYICQQHLFKNTM